MLPIEEEKKNGRRCLVDHPEYKFDNSHTLSITLPRCTKFKEKKIEIMVPTGMSKYVASIL
jgi:hypothetical protein